MCRRWPWVKGFRERRRAERGSACVWGTEWMLGGAMVLFLCLSACGQRADDQVPTPDSDSPLRLAIHGAPSVLDPHLQSESVAQTVLGNVFETLVAFDHHMRLEPYLAETWDNPSDLVWRFRIRRGVRFHDGRELTLDDVIASLERAMSHPYSRQAGSLVAVSEIRRAGPWTLELKTSKPYPILLNRLAFIGIVPADSPDEIAQPIGTGPYRFVEQERRWIRLEAVVDHWRHQGHPLRVEYHFESDAGARAEALEAGEVDFIDEVDVQDVKRLEEGGAQVMSLSSLNVSYVHMDPTVPPFDDIRVRRAISLALDRSQIVESLHLGHALPVDQMVSRNVFGFDPRLEITERDLEAARRLLKEAGYDDGLDVVLHSRKGRRVDALVEQWREAGIRVTVETRPWDETYARLLDREVPFYFGTWVCTSGDAGDALDRKFHTRDPGRGYGDANHGGYSNPQLDTLIERTNEFLQLEERQRLLQQALKTARDDAVYVAIYSRNEIYALAADLQWTARQDGRVFAYEMRRE